MQKVTLTVTLTVDGDAHEMAKLLGQYLTEPDYPFAEDYGAGWGGYEGPFVRGVEIKSEFGQSFVSDDRWPEPDIEEDEVEDDEERFGPTESHDVGGEPWRRDQV